MSCSKTGHNTCLELQVMLVREMIFTSSIVTTEFISQTIMQFFTRVLMFHNLYIFKGDASDYPLETLTILVPVTFSRHHSPSFISSLYAHLYTAALSPYLSLLYNFYFQRQVLSLQIPLYSCHLSLKKSQQPFIPSN